MERGRNLHELVAFFLEEDVGQGDVTTKAVVPPGTTGRARIEAREPFTVAGLEPARLSFELLDPGVSWIPEVDEGAAVPAGGVIARIEGSLEAILVGERTALNLLARLCAVATLTSRFVAAVAGTATEIVDTRKTTPGFRLLEKAAVRAGGGRNHRFGLDDGILIKDNHVKVAGGVGEAVARARNGGPHGLVVQVEVTTIEELDEALEAGAGAILLDNMDPQMVATAVDRVAGAVVLEASGGITLDNVRSYAETGVDRISIGALTHSAGSVDVSLEVE